jgi:two-component system osmolarity sensor histidine kinase EnvZ
LRTLSQSIAGNISLVLIWHDSGDTTLETIQNLARTNMAMEVDFRAGAKLQKTGQHRDSWLYTPLITAVDEKISVPYYVRITPDDVIVSIETKDGIMDISLERKRFFSRTTPLVIIWTTVSALILFAVASLFMRNQIRPIRRLAEVADRFGRGEDTLFFKPEGAMEVRKAGYAFIRMRERVQRLLSERLEMLAGVSHDLRTPITRLKLSVVMLPQAPSRTQIESDVNMLHHMVEGFLAYARGEGDEVAKITTLVPWMQAIADQHAQLHIHISGADSITAHIKPMAMHRCVSNIISNSQKYAKHLEIAVAQVGASVIVTFEDDGVGIPVHERENVFKPFYRLDQARNLDHGGVGLGLSVVRDCVLGHGGHLELGDSSLGGLKVVMRLPV